jgi:hypothetical protein
MNTTTSYKIIKLTNGENLICEINDDVDDGEYKINFPLKMEVRSMVTKEGVVDSLNLVRWIGPYTEQSFFSIKRDHVLLVADASEGLSRYYEHIIKEIKQLDTSKKRSSLDDINDEDIYDELLEELETDNNTIH